jgi:hypothetical protein
MVSSAQAILPESTGVAVQTSSADVRDEDFGNATQSEAAGVGVERLPRIGGTRRLNLETVKQIPELSLVRVNEFMPYIPSARLGKHEHPACQVQWFGRKILAFRTELSPLSGIREWQNRLRPFEVLPSREW